jgi:hypothetical protein
MLMRKLPSGLAPLRSDGGIHRGPSKLAAGSRLGEMRQAVLHYRVAMERMVGTEEEAQRVERDRRRQMA